MRFLDRHRELDRLHALMARSEGGLAVLWGRRRVGKTRLLLEWCLRHRGVYTVADQSAPGIQRHYLAESLAPRFPGLAEVHYPTWHALLRRIAQSAAAQAWRGPLVFDEFPWLAAASPELPSVIQRWWEEDARPARLVVALAGSSQRMMQGLVLDAAAPLYGRADDALEVQPLAAGHIGPALRLTDPVECLRAYSVWGGVPRYWELADGVGADLDTAVDRCVLDPLAPLHQEPERLLLEEQPPATSLRPILDAIGLGAHRLSEIAGRIGQPATSFGRPLVRLVQLGLVRREIPSGESEKSSKRALYRVADPFFRFWFRTVAPHRALLAQAPRRVRLGVWKAARTRLFAEAWEDLCRAAVSGLRTTPVSSREDDPWEPARRFWHGGGPEWDVVAASLSGRRMLLGEVKWAEHEVSAAELRHLTRAFVAKGLPPVLRSDHVEVHRVLFVPSAVRPRRPVSGVRIVDAAEVLRVLT
ncbi:MAG: ATP-binding protein [Planctomycetes bacterium]|nr:ATP-binding protein [Planctomycetota bacterium]